MGEHELGKRRAALAQCEHRAGVRNRGLDLLAVANDARVPEQPLDVGGPERGDQLGIEPREGAAESLALAQDRQPRETRLESLEAHTLVQAALVEHGTPPLLVVVALVQGVAIAETANSPGKGIAQGRPLAVR